MCTCPVSESGEAITLLLQLTSGKMTMPLNGDERSAVYLDVECMMQEMFFCLWKQGVFGSLLLKARLSRFVFLQGYIYS